MFTASWFPGSANIESIELIRTEVFVREKGIPAESEFNAGEIAAHLLVMHEDGTPIATARITLNHGSLYLGYIAVRTPYRKQGFEDFALRMLLYKAQQMSYPKITSEAEVEEIPLYEKFGFKRTGKQIQRYGITYHELTVSCDGIIFDRDCKHEGPNQSLVISN